MTVQNFHPAESFSTPTFKVAIVKISANMCARQLHCIFSELGGSIPLEIFSISQNMDLGLIYQLQIDGYVSNTSSHDPLTMS